MVETQAPLILAVETATRAGSVSLARGSKILDSLSGDPVASHSSDLIENISKLLQAQHVNLRDVSLFAAAVGPGSFTGLRIGLATIKGFAASLARECVGVSTMAAIAHAVGVSQATVALLPAGRGELYAQLLRVDENGAVSLIDRASHLNPKAVLEKYAAIRLLKWAGEGAHLHAAELRAWSEDNGIAFAEGPSSRGSLSAEWTLTAPCERLAESIAALALLEYQNGNAISASDLRATYVRPSDAEINEGWHKHDPPSATHR